MSTYHDLLGKAGHPSKERPLPPLFPTPGGDADSTSGVAILLAVRWKSENISRAAGGSLRSQSIHVIFIYLQDTLFPPDLQVMFHGFPSFKTNSHFHTAGSPLQPFQCILCQQGLTDLGRSERLSALNVCWAHFPRQIQWREWHVQIHMILFEPMQTTSEDLSEKAAHKRSALEAPMVLHVVLQPSGAHHDAGSEEFVGSLEAVHTLASAERWFLRAVRFLRGVSNAIHHGNAERRRREAEKQKGEEGEEREETCLKRVSRSPVCYSTQTPRVSCHSSSPCVFITGKSWTFFDGGIDQGKDSGTSSASSHWFV